MLVKPTTYMNNSGIAVRQVTDYYGIENHEILVVLDDFNIDKGRIRIRKTGSDGGHNGLSSIILHMKSEDFPRMRIGIGRDERMDPADFVLSKFPDEEMRELTEKGVYALNTILEEGIEKAMNKINSRSENE